MKTIRITKLMKAMIYFNNPWTSSSRQVQAIQLGSLEILKHKVEAGDVPENSSQGSTPVAASQAVLTLQNDELLKTVVGTLDAW